MKINTFPVFAPPKMSVPLVDHVIGFYASTLVKDDGELQVGIGSLGDALVFSLLLRHGKNKKYLEVANRLGISSKEELQPFTKGLFGASEMFC